MMLLLLLIVFLVLVFLAASLSYLLGFRLGGESTRSEITRIKLEAAQSERQLHDLTRQAFVAMAKHVEQRQFGDKPNGQP
jgi:hypothetical protein